MQRTSNRANYNHHYYSQSFIKLREVTLSYRFDKQILNNTFFNTASLSLVGRNLMLFSDAPNIDPDSGSDNLQTPSTRNIGVNLKLNF
jgi:hypothetical protein